jgi:hypothetical protein
MHGGPVASLPHHREPAVQHGCDLQTAISAARMRYGSFATDSWNARAVPWKVPWTDVGSPSRTIAALIAWTAPAIYRSPSTTRG